MDKELYETYVRILNKELVTAMGCTEPIAIAYAGSLARKTLGDMPNKILIEVSGNIIKNVKSVIVPHTHGNKGIETAACIGITGGDAEAELEVISHVKEEDIISWRNTNDLTFINCACRFTEGCSLINDGTSKRKEIKELIKNLRKINKNIDNNIFKALDNVNLNCVLSYIQNGEKHSFLDDYDNKKNKQ